MTSPSSDMHPTQSPRSPGTRATALETEENQRQRVNEHMPEPPTYSKFLSDIQTTMNTTRAQQEKYPYHSKARSQRMVSRILELSEDYIVGRYDSMVRGYFDEEPLAVRHAARVEELSMVQTALELFTSLQTVVDSLGPMDGITFVTDVTPSVRAERLKDVKEALAEARRQVKEEFLQDTDHIVTPILMTEELTFRRDTGNTEGGLLLDVQIYLQAARGLPYSAVETNFISGWPSKRTSGEAIPLSQPSIDTMTLDADTSPLEQFVAAYQSYAKQLLRLGDELHAEGSTISAARNGEARRALFDYHTLDFAESAAEVADVAGKELDTFFTLLKEEWKPFLSREHQYTLQAIKARAGAHQAQVSADLHTVRAQLNAPFGEPDAKERHLEAVKTARELRTKSETLMNISTAVQKRAAQAWAVTHQPPPTRLSELRDMVEKEARFKRVIENPLQMLSPTTGHDPRRRAKSAEPGSGDTSSRSVSPMPDRQTSATSGQAGTTTPLTVTSSEGPLHSRAELHNLPDGTTTDKYEWAADGSYRLIQSTRMAPPVEHASPNEGAGESKTRTREGDRHPAYPASRASRNRPPRTQADTSPKLDQAAVDHAMARLVKQIAKAEDYEAWLRDRTAAKMPDSPRKRHRRRKRHASSTVELRCESQHLDGEGNTREWPEALSLRSSKGVHSTSEAPKLSDSSELSGQEPLRAGVSHLEAEDDNGTATPETKALNVERLIVRIPQASQGISRASHPDHEDAPGKLPDEDAEAEEWSVGSPLVEAQKHSFALAVERTLEEEALSSSQAQSDALQLLFDFTADPAHTASMRKMMGRTRRVHSVDLGQREWQS